MPPEKSPKKGKAAVVQEPEVMPAPQSRYVIVLADSDLSPLPLEALEWLQQDGVKSVSRDFSVNCLHQRMMRVAPPVAQPGLLLWTATSTLHRWKWVHYTVVYHVHAFTCMITGVHSNLLFDSGCTSLPVSARSLSLGVFNYIPDLA